MGREAALPDATGARGFGKVSRRPADDEDEGTGSLASVPPETDAGLADEAASAAVDGGAPAAEATGEADAASTEALQTLDDGGPEEEEDDDAAAFWLLGGSGSALGLLGLGAAAGLVAAAGGSGGGRDDRQPPAGADASDTSGASGVPGASGASTSEGLDGSSDPASSSDAAGPSDSASSSDAAAPSDAAGSSEADAPSDSGIASDAGDASGSSGASSSDASEAPDPSEVSDPSATPPDPAPPSDETQAGDATDEMPDLTTPVAPPPTPAPTLVLVSDTGDSSIDRITSDGTLRVEGVVPGHRWEFSLDGGQTWVTGTDGEIPGTCFSDSGSHTVLVRQSDDAGSASEIGEFAFFLDREVAVPVLSLPGTPVSVGDTWVTSSPQALVSGLEEGATWEYSIDGGLSWKIGTGGAVDLSDLQEGPTEVWVRQTDIAGNVSAIGQLGFVLDTSAAAPELSLMVDSGVSATDGVTSDGRVAIQGLEDGATWHYSIDGGNTWQVGTGTSLDLSGLPDGDVQLLVRQTDLAGNVSSASQLDVVLDTSAAPPSPTLTLDTGASAADRVTRDASITVQGLEDGALWDYSVDGGTTWLAGSGTTLDLSAVPDGEVQLLVRQTDVAGNASEAASLDFVLDTTVTAPALLLLQDTGTSASDGITRDGRVQILDLETGATWDYSLDGGLTWTAGSGTILDLADITSGPIQLLVRQTDIAGNVSGVTSLDLVLDTTSDAPTLTLHTDTGSDATDLITQVGQIQIEGLETDATWDYSTDGGVTWLPGTGTSLDLSAMPDGNVQLLVRQTDVSGNSSAMAQLDFVIDTAVSVPSVTLAEDSGASATDHVTRNGLLEINDLEPGATWAFSLDDGLTWTQGEGSSLDLAAVAGAGHHTVQIRQSDRAGNISEITRIDLTVLLDAPTIDLLTDAGLQDETRVVVGINAAQQGVSLVSTTAELSTAELRTLYIRIDAGFAADDQFSFHDGPVLDRDLSATDLTLLDIPGLDLRYDATTRLLVIQKSDGTTLTGMEASTLANALRLTSLGTVPTSGERTVSIWGEDLAGNVGAPSTVRVTIDIRAPSLDLNGALDGVEPLTHVGSLATPVRVFAEDLTITHDNPDARYSLISVRGFGGGTSVDDQLCSQTALGLITLEDGLQWQLGETVWTVTRVSTRYSFTTADGSLASQEAVTALLESLRLMNDSVDPGQGERRFTVVLTDEVGNSGRAEGSVVLDHIAPIVDLNGLADGLDHATQVAAGVSWMLPVFNPATASLTDDSPITLLTLTFSSALSNAFQTAAGQQERIGLSDGDDTDGMADALVLGLGGTLINDRLIPGRTITLTLSADAAQPTLVISADAPLTAEQASQLLQWLRFEGDANAALGGRTVAVTATDVAGNTSATPTLSQIQVLPEGTPMVFLHPDSDSGTYHSDSITRLDGSAAAPLRLRGAGRPGATLLVYLDADRDGVGTLAEQVGTVVCDAQGRWELQLPANALADGSYQFIAVDAVAGLTSPALTMTVDTRPPASAYDMGASVALSPVLFGVSDAFERVLVEIDTDNNLLNGYELRYETRSDAAGQWQIDTRFATPVWGSFESFRDGATVNTRVTTFDMAGNTTVREDSAPAIASVFNLSDAQVVEGVDGTRELVFMVSRSGDLSSEGSVDWSLDLLRSSATNNPNGLLSDLDFSGAASGRVQFAAGETQQLVRFTVAGDYYREVNERLMVHLEDAQGGTIGDGLGIGTIYEVDIDRMQAAYSMRNLNPNLNTASIRVRRSSDDQEMDIGFDANGLLDRTALLNFVGRGSTDRGFVTTWYDQSGHGRDMVQSVASKQGVVVDGGVVVTRADGTVGISFNSRNGTSDDFMMANGLAGKDWTSALIYAKVQSEGSRDGSLFNLGTSQSGRLSAHYPEGSRGYVFDVNNYDATGRLSRAVSGGNSALVGLANDIVFEAHSGNTTAGTASLNYTDSAQAIYENGVRVTSDSTLAATFPTSTQWRLAMHGTDSAYYQQVIYNEFMVYLDTANSTPEMQSLLGTANDDVLTYSGERSLLRIDGMAGHDTLYLSGATDIDFGQFSGGVRGLAQVWMDNDRANTLTLTTATLAANGSMPLTVVMGEGDSVVLNGQRFDYDEDRLQTLVIGQDRDEVLFSTNRNDVMRGGAGADTFTWRAEQGGVDTVLDFSDAQGDRLDLSLLLQRMTAGREDLYLNRQLDANGQVMLLVDRDGRGHFQAPDLVILLGSAHPADSISIVTQYGVATL